MYPNCSYMLWPSLYEKPQRLPPDLLRLRADTCHSEGVRRGGCSNGNKPLVTPTVVMFTLSNFTGSSRGPLFGLSLLYFSIFSQSSILQFSLGCLCPLSLSMIVSMKTHTYTHKHTHTLAPSLSLSTSLFSPNLVEVGLICAPGQLIWFPLLSCEQLPFLSDQNLFIECSASGSIILNVLPE